MLRAAFRTDDREALRHAKFLGITTRETADLVGMATVDGYVTAPDGFALLNRVADSDRGLRIPKTAADLLRRQRPSPSCE